MIKFGHLTEKELIADLRANIKPMKARAKGLEDCESEDYMIRALEDIGNMLTYSERVVNVLIVRKGGKTAAMWRGIMDARTDVEQNEIESTILQ